MSFGDTQTAGDFARGASAGGVSGGGVYAFDVGNGGPVNRALGVQPIGADFTPGSIVFRLVNQTGVAVRKIKASFKTYYRNDQGRANRLTWDDSLDGTNFFDFGGDAITSPEAANPTPQWVLAADKAISIGFASGLAHGDAYYFRFLGDDVSGSGFRDEFAIDDVSFTATIPEPATWWILSFGLFFRRRRNRESLAQCCC